MFCGTVGDMENRVKMLHKAASDQSNQYTSDDSAYHYYVGRESAFREVMGIFRRFWVANGFPDAPHGTESQNRGSEGV